MHFITRHLPVCKPVSVISVSHEVQRSHFSEDAENSDSLFTVKHISLHATTRLYAILLGVMILSIFANSLQLILFYLLSGVFNQHCHFVAFVNYGLTLKI